MRQAAQYLQPVKSQRATSLLSWGSDPPGTPRWPVGPRDFVAGAAALLVAPARGLVRIAMPTSCQPEGMP